jgi:hypothetical protein
MQILCQYKIIFYTRIFIDFVQTDTRIVEVTKHIYCEVTKKILGQEP